MFLGLDFYSDVIVFNTEVSIANIYDVQLGNSIIDEIKLDETILSYTNAEKSEWDYETALLGTMQNTLECGNVNNGGMEIEYIRFKKRKIDSLQWQIVEDIPFNYSDELYTVVDRLVQATEIYEYSVTPLTSNVEGKENTTEIFCEFDGVWLVDKKQGVQFKCNLEYGDIENVTKVAVFEPLQSKYPFIQSNILDYHKGSISSVLLSIDTLNGNNTSGRQVNVRQERLLKESVFNFLKNRKPKILKDGSGRFYLVMILGNPKERPVNSIQGDITGVQFEWIEIGDALNSDDLKNVILT